MTNSWKNFNAEGHGNTDDARCLICLGSRVTSHKETCSCASFPLAELFPIPVKWFLLFSIVEIWLAV